jgi:hypothetical protein
MTTSSASTSAPATPVVELELIYEPDDDAVAEAIAILLGDDAAAQPGQAA